ncbi:MAG TPA: alpha-2-macroglobulin family protein [Flavipsychrobacter sp.]|nr:alpha-2-macroglobulin family protein [Flavipsychrobacter sp.]
MTRHLLLFVFLLAPFFLLAQPENEPYSKEWKRADSLLQNGFPESAAKIAQSIYDRASKKNEQVQMVKAQLYLMSADFQRNEEAFQDAIKKAEQNATTASFPNNAIWQSIAAQLYWNYYQQYRWKILDRTKVSANTGIEDFEQWDANRFFEKASSLYLASLSRSKELEQIKIEQYDPILIKGVNTRNLRPTLFDLLAFRALEYFENNEKDITKPAFAFVMNDAKAFGATNEFITANFKTQDSTSLQWQALKLYQRILSLHSDDGNKDAFIDADMHRLQFAYNNSVHPDKKELYKQALERIEQQHSDNSLSALASFRIAQLMMTTERTRMDFDQSFGDMERNPQNYPAIKERLEKIIAKFPESEGGILAKQLLQQILSKDLNVTIEEVVLPDEASKILISYRNVPKVWIRLVKLNNAQNKYIGSHYGYTQNLNKEILAFRALKEWNVNLPATEDYERHSAEVKIDALKNGAYALIISSKENFEKEDNILSYAVFQVSRLSAISGNGQGFALDRKTGDPIKNANVDFYRQRYNDNIRGYDLVKTSTLTTDENGKFIYDKNNDNNNAIRIRHGKDTVMLAGYFSGYNHQQESKPEKQTFFFTDRSIYRPGQTIFFKGIMLRKENGGRKNNVIANQTTTVVLYDVNGQKVESKTFTTNEFGSFSGSFTAPQGLLTGNMRIANENGGADFSVEEYKRPKFSVSFDTLKKAYALNETITVSGKAVAYAGNNIDNATVKYRVVRNARFPYWWYAYRWGFPRSPQMEIVNGVTTTDQNGSFKIDFNALPDPAVDPQSLPVFTYTVSADVTDINGETRSSNSMVSVGYTSLQLAINIPDKARPEDLDSISITSVNLNDQFVATDLQVKISKLKQPLTVLRKRLWQTPDQFIMDSLSFKSYFPNDVYRDEDNHLKWNIERTTLERSIKTTKEGLVIVPSKTWNENGWYVIEVTATDKSGKKLTEKKYVQVWSERNEGKTNEALVVLPQSQQKEPGEKATWFAITGYEQLHTIQQITRTNSSTTKHVTLSPGEGRGEASITETDRGGVLVNYITVKENRVYQQQAVINVPWSNKDLNISWETHRDKLLPGAKETWTMVVRGNKKEKLAAEMVATLYDASLDAFRPHEWNVYGLFPSLYANSNWNGLGFGQSDSRQMAFYKTKPLAHTEKRYDQLLSPDGQRFGIDGIQLQVEAKDARVSYKVARGVATASQSQDEVAAANVKFTPPSLERAEEAKANSNSPQKDFPVRKNLQETAFFFPHLKTDNEGNIRIEFTIPEALTEWKLMAFTHTKDMSRGMLKGSVKTQKDLMVMPNLPRFLRQGDEIVISSKISNLSDKDLNGTATIELLNATTMQPVHLPFRLQQKDQSFSVAKGQSTTASWKLHVPESMYEPVVIRILARSGDFTDGEENVVPVITNRMLVTETLPLWINGNGTKNFSFDKLKYSNSSKTLVHNALTVEYTGNPAWYAVQSLPYLMEYPYECAEQVFNRYYATALAAHIVQQSPKIKAIFDKWKEEAMFSSFSSPLEKNQELKSALLEETPWVMEAKTESEQRKRLGQLFDTYKLSKDLDATMRKLKDMQLPEGGFPWFKGMRPDRFITQYIITGLGRLKHLGVKDSKGITQQLLARALPYLDRETKESYDLLVRSKAKLDAQNIGYTEVQYLYMRSFFSQPIEAANKTAYNYYKSQAAKHWAKFNPYMKGMIAIALHRANDKETPKSIIQSLKETAIRKEEMGMYWMQRGYSYWWYDAPIEAQALLIETFKEVANDNASVDAMKIWLLKNKQTNSWETTKATADACYALLLSGTDWLTNEPKVVIQLGDKAIRSEEQKNEAGSGYFKVRYAGNEIKPEHGNIVLTVSDNQDDSKLKTQNSTLPSWGAVYWQYFENLDKIASAKTPLEIKKQLFIERNTARGLELVPITENNPLKVGDKVISRIEIIVDRDMEYVHLKDMRASAFEPVNIISSYKWQGGLGYYQSTKDVSTNFFFDYLRKGKYVFEYPVFVQQTGDFSNGIATIQCMYAPEFSSHSEGIRVKVAGK